MKQENKNQILYQPSQLQLCWAPFQLRRGKRVHMQMSGSSWDPYCASVFTANSWKSFCSSASLDVPCEPAQQVCECCLFALSPKLGTHTHTQSGQGELLWSLLLALCVSLCPDRLSQHTNNRQKGADRGTDLGRLFSQKAWGQPLLLGSHHFQWDWQGKPTVSRGSTSRCTAMVRAK